MAKWTCYQPRRVEKLGRVAEAGTFTCATTAMSDSNSGRVYSSSYGASTCSVTIVTVADASGEHFSGAYEATLFQADGTTSVTLTQGKFDGILP